MGLRSPESVSLWPAFSAATSCSVALSVISLICSDFIFRSPVRGFGSLTRGRGTKGPHWQENGRVLDQGAGADGNRRDTSRRVARRGAGWGGITGDNRRCQKLRPGLLPEQIGRRLRFLTLVHAGLDGDEKYGEINGEVVTRNCAAVARLTARIWRENTFTNLLVGQDLPGIQKLLLPCSLESDCAKGCCSAKCGATALLHSGPQH